METIVKVDIHTWSGYDSAGRRVEYVEAGDRCFGRAYQYNGYGMSWGSWFSIEEKATRKENSDSVEWGFNTLLYSGINNRLKLPKIK